MASHELNELSPVYADYFHTNMISSTGSAFGNSSEFATIRSRMADINKPFLFKETDDGNNLLVLLRGQLYVPDTPGTKWPLLIIMHGAHRIWNDDKKEIFSYNGYQELQKELAKKNIASYSIDLYLPNRYPNGEPNDFNNRGVDSSQRIQLLFLHLKLLKILAGETVTEPPSGDQLPLKYLKGATLVNVNDVHTTLDPVADSKLKEIKDAIVNKIDFTKLAVMGHSRGADAAARTPAYFFKGANPAGAKFPVNGVLDGRIKSLCTQVGNPTQDMIKCILALEPTATKNDADPTNDPAKQGYVIDNNQTIFFLGVGTDDEDVTFDAIRMYEYPQCPKVMIAINGASHKRFNTTWANDDDSNSPEFDGGTDPPNLLTKDKHMTILRFVFGSCFTATLGGKSKDLRFFTKEQKFPFDVPITLDFQGAWKFDFPLQSIPTSLDSLEAKVTGITTAKLKDSSFKFEQDVTAFYVEKDGHDSFSFNIPVTPGSVDDPSKFTHFSFRMAKGGNDNKNFNIRLMQNGNPLGNSVDGDDFADIELTEYNAYDLTTDPTKRTLQNSIVLQTIEVPLASHFSNSDLGSATGIEINITTQTSWKGGIGSGVLGAALGAGIAIAYHELENGSEPLDKNTIALSGFFGALAGVGIYELVKVIDKAYAFKDFLLTRRVIP